MIAMEKYRYCPPETEVILVRMDRNFLIYNQDFNEEDDDIFGDGND